MCSHPVQDAGLGVGSCQALPQYQFTEAVQQARHFRLPSINIDVTKDREQFEAYSALLFSFLD